jgi:FkbM family methyltransferase
MPNFNKRLRRTIQRFGYDVQRVGPRHLGRDHISDIKLLCHGNVETIFDVGANVGQAALGFVEEFRRARIFSFEPFPASFAKLKQNVARFPQVVPRNVALGDRPGKATLRVQHGSELNSLLTPASDATRHISAVAMAAEGECEVAVNTIDESFEQERVSKIDLLKIDTQGFELKVLEGATGALKRRLIRVILLEVNFVPLYQAQPSLGELLDFLGPHSYRLVGIYEPAYAPEGYIKWADALFVSSANT